MIQSLLPGKRQLLIDQRTVPAGAVSFQIAGPNPSRYALVLSCPPASDNPEANSSVYVAQISTAAGGAKATYTVPAGVQAVLTSASFFQSAGVAGVICLLQITRAANTTNIIQPTNSGSYVGAIPLSAGDTVTWFCTTAVAASTSDFTIGITQDNVLNRVTVGFNRQPVVLDQGVNLYAGQTPLILLYDHIGQAIREPIFGICSLAGQTISCIDVSEVLCECSNDAPIQPSRTSADTRASRYA
jgi:hypothetical protein